MAIIREPSLADGSVNYVATLAFFGCVSCMVLMLKFRGFRASLNFASRSKEEELAPAISITGSYQIKRDEFYGSGSLSDRPTSHYGKLTPSMVKLQPSSKEPAAIRNAKSTSNLVQPTPTPPQPQLHKSTNDVSSDPRGGPSSQQKLAPAPARPERKKKDKNEEKAQQKLEKQRLAEQKAREKAAAQEQAKQEKLRREREKKEAQEQAKIAKMNKKKKQAPTPQKANPLARSAAPRAPAPPAPPPPAHSYAPRDANTRPESSISKTSGPPPYDERASDQMVKLQNSNPTDVSFGKKIDESDSWDMISRHRQQLSRPVSTGLPRTQQKNMVMDLNYTMGKSNENSEA